MKEDHGEKLDQGGEETGKKVVWTVESPKVPVSSSDTHGVSRKHDVWARITSFWWQSWSHCPSTDGQVRVSEVSLAWCSIAWDQWGKKAKKESARAKKIGWRGELSRGPPKIYRLARFAHRLFLVFHSIFSPFPQCRAWSQARRCSIVQVSSLTQRSLQVPGTNRMYNFTVKRLGGLFGPEALIRV